MLFFWTLC